MAENKMQVGIDLCKIQRGGVFQDGTSPCSTCNTIKVKLGGGYRPTAKNLKYLRLWRQGKSIGFTMRSSLKAKGLIPRASGKYEVSEKYRGGNIHNFGHMRSGTLRLTRKRHSRKHK